MNTDHDAERARRVTLSYASEPGDEITTAMIARHGTADTLDAITAASLPALRGIDHAATLAWQERLARRLPDRSASGILEACLQHGIRVVIPDDPDWPSQLEDLPNPPVAIYVRGDLSFLGRRLDSIVTITGCRAESGYGQFVTQETVQGLAADGFTIVSGIAYGIEESAQQAALANGDRSVGFLAGGLDRPYPSGLHELTERIAAQGALVSELPPGTTPTRWRFLQRGRLLAAASTATIVVEAGARSGALHVAAHAARLGRDVAAFPGPVTSSNSAGTNLLIADGVATLVTQAEDIRRMIDRDGPDATPPAAPGNVAPRRAAQRTEPIPATGEPHLNPAHAGGTVIAL